MQQGSPAFYETVATILPVFGFLAVYQRAHLLTTFTDVGERLLSDGGRSWWTLVGKLLVRAFRPTTAATTAVVFIAVVVGEYRCLASLKSGNPSEGAADGVMQIAAYLLAWLVFVEVLGGVAKVTLWLEVKLPRHVAWSPSTRRPRAPIGPRPATRSSRRHARKPPVARRRQS